MCLQAAHKKKAELAMLERDRLCVLQGGPTRRDAPVDGVSGCRLWERERARLHQVTCGSQLQRGRQVLRCVGSLPRTCSL